MNFSPVIAGCMNWGQWGAKFNTQQYLTAIKECLDLGLTWFDHADIYGHYTTEEEFGNALKEEPGLRANLKLITKCGIKMVTPHRPDHKIKSYDTSSEHIIRSVERSLSNLRTDHIDLLLIHRPDPMMDATEIADAMDKLQTQGKVLHFGVSNFLPHHMSLLRPIIKVEANQFEFSAFHTAALHDGTAEYCQQHGIACMSWSPLGGGVLTAEEKTDQARRVIAVAEWLGEELGLSIDQVLLAWLFSHPMRIVPVLGTTKTSRIKAATEAAKLKLSREQWFMVYRAYLGKEVP
ncbi:MAG TPA: aldo/keto reductase [Chitinophagaceae bacterium]|nr:aldo/keto reductase [Chitinophagaceae bacterium]